MSLLIWVLCLVIAIFFPLPGTFALFILITPIWLVVIIVLCIRKEGRLTRALNNAEWNGGNFISPQWEIMSVKIRELDKKNEYKDGWNLD